jgi:hypothetical protein
MSESSWLSEFCGSISQEVDSELSDLILEGYETQNEDNKEALLKWLMGVLVRFDTNVDIETRTKIMKKMGYACAIQHNAHIDAKTKRDRFTTLDEYIAHEEDNPNPAYSIKREGDKVIVTYMPKAMGIRCFCGPWSEFEVESKTSLTYCYCSAGHVEYIWRYVIGKPIQVDLLCSCISGDDSCKFIVNLEPK